jgi:hypothetical protein
MLLGQSPTVTPASPGDPAPFAIEVEVGGPVPAGAELGLSFYKKLGTRSAFEQTLSTPPSSADLLQTVSPQSIADLRSVHGGGVELTTTVVPDTAEPSGADTVDLGSCAIGSGLCSGVYPVVIQLLDAGGTAVAHLTTYLTYAEERSSNPLVFSWVVPMAAPVRVRTHGSLSVALPPLTPSRVRDLAQLGRSLVKNGAVKVSIAPSPATMQKLAASTSANAHAALLAIGALAASGPASHQLLTQPYVPVNLGALSAGLNTEILGQVEAAEAVMTPLLHGLAAVDQPSSSTWVANGPVNPAIVKGLGSVGATSLVLPDTDLPPATELDHATWSQPFTLSTGKGQGITAAVSDGQLSSYFTAEPQDPVLAANQLLADLAIIHYELPGASDPTRGVIAVPPSGWDPDPRFVTTLLAGLAGDPVVTTATLAGFFNLVHAGGNRAATTRRLGSNEDSGLIGPQEAAAIVAARKQITGFDKAVQGSPAVLTELEYLLLASESSELRPAAQQAGIAAFERHLGAELADVQVLANTVTLTARTGSIPITIVSTAGYHLRATLTLSSAKLEFPAGATRTVLIDHTTNSVQVEVRARTSGDLPLAFTLTSPDGALLIAHGRLTVRSTATSIVGIVLTVVAAVVLGGWWIRTWRKSRRARPARPARGTAT